MKKFVFTLIILGLSSFAIKSFAQDTLKEGIFVTVITYPDDEKKIPPYKVTNPVTYFKNGSSRREGKFEDRSFIRIYNKKTGEEYSAEDKNGEKFDIITSSDTLKKLLVINPDYKPRVELTNDTKVILGYHCNKAFLIYPKDTLKHRYECWYTKEIQLDNPLEYSKRLLGMDAFIIEMTEWGDGFPFTSIKTTVTSIEKTRVPDSLFNMPTGYRVTTWDKLKKEKDAFTDSIMNLNKKIEASNDSLYKINEPIEDSLIRTTFPLGSTLPEIELSDTSGQPLKLSSLRGKYVLVDFWASWCSPCRAENPTVINAYNKYKDRGLTVFSISLDDKKPNWIKAIKHDKLTWPYHVCDFGGWYSPVVEQFKVNGIPFNYLIDKEGRVIAYNIHGDDLDEALSKYIK